MLRFLTINMSGPRFKIPGGLFQRRMGHWYFRSLRGKPRCLRRKIPTIRDRVHEVLGNDIDEVTLSPVPIDDSGKVSIVGWHTSLRNCKRTTSAARVTIRMLSGASGKSGHIFSRLFGRGAA